MNTFKRQYKPNHPRSAPNENKNEHAHITLFISLHTSESKFEDIVVITKRYFSPLVQKAPKPAGSANS